ncbi:MAG: hypothetical protein QG660_705 [Pseudomonadota bacterium]|nr:hypothetical protein [Pseudomonadota bacterium]
MDLLIWGGPVRREDLNVQLPDDVVVLTLSHGPGGSTDIGSSGMSNLALSFKDVNGKILPNLCARYGFNVGDFDRIYMAGFSAFHGLLNEVLKVEADRITGAVCLDACFSAKEHLEKAGFVAFGERAARGDALFVLSASAGGGDTFSTGSQCVWAQAKAVESATGVEMDALQVPEPLPVPEYSGRIGRMYIYDYGAEHTHAWHVHVLGKMLLEAYLLPDIEHRSSEGVSASEGSSWWGPAVAVGVAVAAVGTGTWVVVKRKENQNVLSAQG